MDISFGGTTTLGRARTPQSLAGTPVSATYNGATVATGTLDANGHATLTFTADVPRGATIVVTYAGLPGNAQDWVSLAPAGTPNTSYVSYIFTGGRTGGTSTGPARRRSLGGWCRICSDRGSQKLARGAALWPGPRMAEQHPTPTPPPISQKHILTSDYLGGIYGTRSIPWSAAAPYLNRAQTTATDADAISAVGIKTEMYTDPTHTQSNDPMPTSDETTYAHDCRGNLRGIHARYRVFEDPAQGGQGPFHVYEHAKADGFADVSRTGSLRVLVSR